MALIESTKDGRPQFRVRWNYQRDEAGKLRYDERRFRDRRRAVSFEREVTAGHTSGTETITVRQLATRWLSDHVDVRCSQRTRKDYHCHVAKRIGPSLGSRQVSKLTPRLLSATRERLLAQGTGARTVNKTLDALRAMIRWGRSEGLCANRMIDDVRRASAPAPKPANPYTPPQVAAIASGCQHLREATVVRVAAYAGLRWSELRALHWTDIDLVAETINLTRSLDLDKTMKGTKSERHRIVPILTPGVVALRRWRENGPGPEASDLVFPTANGKPMGEHNWYGQRLPKIRAACGIDFGLHELRDTYASILIQSGIGEAELTLWLGHRSIQTTISRYGKLFERRKAKLVAAANNALADM